MNESEKEKLQKIFDRWFVRSQNRDYHDVAWLINTLREEQTANEEKDREIERLREEAAIARAEKAEVRKKGIKEMLDSSSDRIRATHLAISRRGLQDVARKLLKEQG